MVLDLTGFGLGVRNKRYALVADDSKITYVGVDDQGLEKSSAEAVLAFLAQ